MKAILVLFSFLAVSVSSFASEKCMLSDVQIEAGSTVNKNLKICYNTKSIIVKNENGVIVYEDNVKDITGAINYIVINAEKNIISINLSDKANESGHIGNILFGILGNKVYFIKTVL